MNPSSNMPIMLADIAIWLVASRNEGKIAAWAAIGAAVGVYLFFRGFRMLQFKRLVLDTPFSKIRSASMGLVELSGMAVGPNTIPAGVTGDPCYYYRATAWELERSGNRSEWKQVANESLFVPFFIEDNTGSILVDAQGANMDVHRNFKDEFGGSFFSSTDMPMGTVQNFLLRYGISGRHVRVEEYCIKPDYPLFVLGTVGEKNAHACAVPEKHLSISSSSINLRWNSGSTGIFSGIPGNQVELNSPGIPSRWSSTIPPSAPLQVAARRAAPATSSWSSVSMDEVHPPAAAANIAAATSGVQTVQVADPAQEVASQSLRPGTGISLSDIPPVTVSANSGFDLNATVAIGKGDSGAPFTISSESQRDVVRALGWKSTACIWGGPILTVTCVYIFLLILGWL